MARKIWIDPHGREIPNNRVTDEEKQIEKIINRIHPKAQKAVQALTELKELFLGDFMEYLNGLSQYGLNEDWKGNATSPNFSQTIRLVREEKERITFDHNINLCQRLVYECLNKWGKNSNVNLKKVVDRAFKPTGSGSLSRQRLFDLRATDVQNDPDWDQAMSYMEKAIKVVDSKAYFAIEVKDAEGNWQRMPLNFYDIKLEVEEESESDSKAA